MLPRPGGWLSRCCAYQGSFRKSSKSVVNSVVHIRESAYFSRLCRDNQGCSLINNCRNSQAIIEKIDSIFGTHTKFRKMEMRGAEVEIRGYKKSQAQLEIVESILRQLKKEQICFDDIVILSASRFDRSVASDLDPAFPVSTERTDRKGKILFSTVHAFKGLESPIVVLVDFDSLDHDQRMNLLYVGMTRARSALYMVVSDKARQTLDVKIREAAKNG